MAGTDLISRQDVIDRINKQREHLRPDVYPQDAIGDAAYRICAEIIERLPSAERKGHWIRTGEDGYCSECKCDMPIFREDWDLRFCETDFCPNCGARMVSE